MPPLPHRCGSKALKDKQSQPVAIQEARQTDAGEILAVQKSAFTEEMKAYGFYDIPPLTETVDDVREAMRAGVMLKAVLEGRDRRGCARVEPGRLVPRRTPCRDAGPVEQRDRAFPHGGDRVALP